MTMDARRLVRALLLTAVLWLATTSVVVGVASATTDGDLVVPQVRPGDRATYTTTQVVLDEETARGDLRAMTEASFEWMAEETVADRDFDVRSAHILRSAYVFADTVYSHEAAYDGATGAPIYQAQAASSTSDGTNYGLVLEDLVGSDGATLQWRAEWYSGDLGPCGVRPAFLAPPQPGDIVAIAGSCGWPGDEAVMLYRADGWRDGPAGRGFRFTSVDHEELHLWYDNLSPFPLLVESPLTDTIVAEYTFGRMFRLERIAYERGESAYPLPLMAEGPGPAPLVPRPAWGLDDSGVEHPFPLSTAFAAAMAESDPPTASTTGTDQTVPDFYAANPSAYVGFASYSDLIDQQGNHHHTWWLAFTDGQDVLGKRVELGPVGFSSVFLPSQTGEAVYVYDWDAEDFTGFPDPAMLPPYMPGAAALLERYDALAGRPGNMYGFIMRCQSETCGAAEAEAVAGYSSGDLYGALQVVGDAVVEHASAWDSIWVADDGRLARTYSAISSSGASFPIVPSATGKEPATVVTTPGWIPSEWSGPTKAAAAGLGLLALLAGALYYLWPAVKGALGLGLFSRTRDDQLLDHPRRAQVLQLVQAEPGIHFQDMARRLDMGRGNLEHHLRKMLAAGLLTKVQNGGYACYFPKGSTDHKVMQAAPVLRSQGGRAVFDAVRANPGASSRDLAVALGLAPSTVSYHLKRLQDAGLVFGAAAGVGVRLSPLGEQAAVAA